jgi:hypothetical protein
VHDDQRGRHRIEERLQGTQLLLPFGATGSYRQRGVILPICVPDAPSQIGNDRGGQASHDQRGRVKLSAHDELDG